MPNMSRRRRKWKAWDRYIDYCGTFGDRISSTRGMDRIHDQWLVHENRRIQRKREREESERNWVLVAHTPEWEPADLPVDAQGNTKPGYICVHPLENGNGLCESNVFEPSPDMGNHYCVVYKTH